MTIPQHLKTSANGVATVHFLLVPEYTMVSLLSAIEPMRVANRMAGKEIFRWVLLSENEDPVVACNRLTLQSYTPISNDLIPDNLFICSSFNPEKHITPKTVAWLRLVAGRGAIIGAVDTACYLLEEADLVRNHRVTMHWEAIPAFRERFPTIDVTQELFEIDRKIITCAGGTASLDLMLYLIQCSFGHELALQVCEQFIKSGIRQKSDAQRIDLAARLGVYNQRLLQVLELMQNNIEEPLSQATLASRIGVSVRQLERLFKQHLQHTPAAYYKHIRLEQSRYMLHESHLSIAAIALACGFNAVAHFTRSYREQFGHSPAQERNTIID